MSENNSDDCFFCFPSEVRMCFSPLGHISISGLLCICSKRKVTTTTKKARQAACGAPAQRCLAFFPSLTQHDSNGNPSMIQWRLPFVTLVQSMWSMTFTHVNQCFCWHQRSQTWWAYWSGSNYVRQKICRRWLIWKHSCTYWSYSFFCVIESILKYLLVRI